MAGSPMHRSMNLKLVTHSVVLVHLTFLVVWSPEASLKHARAMVHLLLPMSCAGCSRFKPISWIRMTLQQTISAAGREMGQQPPKKKIPNPNIYQLTVRQAKTPPPKHQNNSSKTNHPPTCTNPPTNPQCGPPPLSAPNHL
jgi:hypothetical protein